MKDKPTDEDEIPPEIDFSTGVRGLHHIPPSAKVFVPASIEREVWEYFSEKAEQRGFHQDQKVFEPEIIVQFGLLFDSNSPCLAATHQLHYSLG
ncbi:MAG: hypothetical protein JO033_25945 [Acidobacteriaceae bacterium]|nr:hypothetical protein [Acidobacteriaceae bacterium]MBV9499669.1 hypothetical protein [Acidobacteriaceae bacterium]